MGGGPAPCPRPPPHPLSQERSRPMDLAGFIDTYKEAIAPAGGRVLPAPLPALRQRTAPPPPPPLPSRRPARRHPRRGPLPRSPPGHDRRRRDGHGQDLHRRGSRPHGGLQAGPRALPAPPRPQVEAGGGGDGPRRPSRHRVLHHRPGEAPALHRPRPPLRRHVPRAGQALLPLAARRGRALGRLGRQAHPGRGDRGALQGPLLPGLLPPGRGQGRRAPDAGGDVAQAAQLRQVRLAPLAGRQLRPQEVPVGRLREAPDEGLLRPACRGRSA